ncbi:MAG: diguanylate cyclase [Woeseiaceae bacterium]
MNAQAQAETQTGVLAVTKVLVVDDDYSIIGVVSEVLEDDGYDVTTASSAEEAMEELKTEQFALVMTDIRLPGINGIGLLEHVKDVSPRTAVIMITSHGSMQTSIEAVRLGAYDYLLKPFEDLSLISNAAKRAVESYNLDLERSQLIHSLKLSNEELERMNEVFHGLAIRDGLTDLFNHRHINEMLDEEIAKTIVEDGDLSLIFVDVDNFKIFNDVNGHQEGDVLLRELSALMRESTRKKDTVARWGGEEFVVLCPGTPEHVAMRLADELRRTIAEHPFKGGESQPHKKITISAGVASFSKNRSKPTLIQAADEALYEAKDKGRNQVCAASAKD